MDCHLTFSRASQGFAAMQPISSDENRLDHTRELTKALRREVESLGN
jgi:hypothetical protein